MTTSHVETFEHDIADEIRHKEASIADIATAVGDIGNTEEVLPKKTSPLVPLVMVLALCGVIGAVYVSYLYYNQATTALPTTTVQTKTVKQTTGLSALSKKIDDAVGTNLTNVQKTPSGYSVGILSYSSVFAYMIKNENDYADELGLAVGNSHTLKAVATTTLATSTTPSAVATNTPITNGTSTGTTTKITATATNELTTTYVFSDITISNQNMRVGKSLYGTVVYSFLGTKTLLISSSTEGILALKSNALKK